MINPWTRTASFEEAVQISGILTRPVNPDVLPKGMKPAGIYCMNGMIEARYQSDDMTLSLRWSKLPVENVAGDYHEYPEETEAALNEEMTLSCKGLGERINLAQFRPFGCTCSISCNPGKPGEGLDLSEIKTIAKAMSR